MFNVGSGLSRIQLPSAIPLAGYQARKEDSRGMHDPLHARALAIECGGSCITILSFDILYSDALLTRILRQAAANAAPLEPSCIMVCCSHTHSGPSCIFPESGSCDPAIIDAIAGAAADATAQAWAKLLPCRLYLGAGEVDGVASRRSDLAGHGAVGPVGQRISVAEFRSVAEGPSGAPRAAMRLVSLACHPTVLGPDNLLVSRDWPGFFVDACEDEMRASGTERAFALFLNGAAADVSTRYTRRAQTFDEAARLGRLAASGAGRVAAIARRSRTSGVYLVSEQITLRRRQLVTEEQALAAIAAAEAEAERLATCGADETTVKESRDRAAAWRIVLGRARNRSSSQGARGATLGDTRGAAGAAQGDTRGVALGAAQGDVIEAEVNLACVGDLTLLFCPGEIAYETGEDLASAVAEGQIAAETETTAPTVRVTRDDIWIVGYSNGHLGYLTPESAAPDAYERVMSSVAPESIHEITQAAMRLSSKGMCMDLC